MSDVKFYIHEYDKDGYAYENGVFLHFGNTRIKVAENFQQFEEFCEKLQNIKHEIVENYGTKF